MMILTETTKAEATIRDVRYGKCVLAKENGVGRKAVVWYSTGADINREITYFDGEKMTYSSAEYFNQNWVIIGPVMQMKQAFVVTAEQF